MALLPKDWLKNLQKNKYLQVLPDFKEEKTRKFITLILTLVTLSFFGIFAIGPTLSTISRLKKELADNRLIENNLKEKINNLSILQGKYATLQGSLPDVYSAIPKTPEIATFMGQVDKIAEEENVDIVTAQTFQVEAVPQKAVMKKYSSFAYTLSIEGSYGSINSFIKRLANMQRIVSFDSLSVSSVYSRQKGNQLRLTIKGTAYFKN